PALQGAAVGEGALHPVEPFRAGESLDGSDLQILRVVRERDAGEDRLAAPGAPALLRQDRAGAAVPLVAALLRPGEPQVVPQRLEQRALRRDGQRMPLAIDEEVDETRGPHVPGSI